MAYSTIDDSNPDRRRSHSDRSSSDARAHDAAAVTPRQGERMLEDHHDDPPARYDGRIRKGEVRNPYGRKGSPTTRLGKQLVIEDLPTIYGRQLSRPVTISENGKERQVPYHEYLIIKAFTSFAQAPVKVQFELLFGQRSPLRPIFEQAHLTDSNGGWNDLLEEEYQVIAARYALHEVASESHLRKLEYDQYLRWCAVESARIGPEAFERIEQTTRYRRYLSDRDEAFTRAENDHDRDRDRGREQDGEQRDRDDYCEDKEGPDLSRFG